MKIKNSNDNQGGTYTIVAETDNDVVVTLVPGHENPHRKYRDSNREERFAIVPGPRQRKSLALAIHNKEISLDALCRLRDEGKLGNSHGGWSQLDI